MCKWVYRLSDNQFLYGGPYEPDCNPAMQGLVSLPRNPQPRAERYDGAGGIRPATDLEIAAYDDAQQLQIAAAKADDLPIRALAAYFIQELNIVRAALPAPLPPRTVNDVRAFVLNFIKARLG